MWTAVRRCWCSAWSPQAVDYAHRLEIELTVEGRQAVVGCVRAVPLSRQRTTLALASSQSSHWP